MSEKKEWPRRAEFVNAVLAWGAGNRYVDVTMDELKFDGTAGALFDRTTNDELTSVECDELIIMALKFGAPVDGLVADGSFGSKWVEVIALAKEEDVPVSI